MTTIIANWKMNGSHSTTEALLEGLSPVLRAAPSGCEVVLCPPFTLLDSVGRHLRGTKVRVGAQNCHQAREGAYTGEISPHMLAESGVTHVLIGHSERREYAGEDDALIAQKLQASHKAGLKTVLCVGETLAEREAGQVHAVVERQLKAVNATHFASYVAYEPVWAIGTGKTPTEIDIASMHQHIKSQTGGIIPVLYGGSVKAENASTILAIPAVAGALVGGASLDIDSFSQILHAAYQINNA